MSGFLNGRYEFFLENGLFLDVIDFGCDAYWKTQPAVIASKDNWRSDQEAEIIATTIPPTNDLESAIVRDLTPGNYTAIVRGVDNATGVALVEAYGGLTC